MLYSFGYVVGDQGERYWKQFIDFHNLNCLHIPKKKMNFLRKEFHDNQATNFLDINQYLVKGVHFKFVESDKPEISRILVIRGSSKEGIEEVLNEFDLSIHKPNLSEQNIPHKD